MKKLSLELDTLAVESFAAGSTGLRALRGTLRAHSDPSIHLTGTETYTCPTYYQCPTLPVVTCP
jgi:hypothetical protein